MLLADHHALIRAGIRVLLEQLAEVEVVGEADNGREALNRASTSAADVLLIDFAMRGLNGLEAAARLIRHHPEVRVLILSDHRNEEFVWRALRAGASGYLLKDAPVAELKSAILRVSRGEIYISPALARQLIREFPWHRSAYLKSPVERLTHRQREILQLIAEGQTTKDIAGVLNVSTKTVEYHRFQLMERLKIHDVPGLVRFALRVGLIANDN